MDISERSPGDRAELDTRVKKERGAKQRDRFRAVAMAIAGYEAEEIAESIDRSRRFVQHWVYAYRDGGIDAIAAKKQPGRPSRLTPEEAQKLVARLEAGPTKEDGVCTLRGLDVVKILEREFGKHYSLNGVYDLLHRLGFSSLSPRPRHRKNDPIAMEQFKKDAPLLSRVSATGTRIRKSKSGVRTKLASASKAP
jgi:transposase